jgi:hypothetical protein
MGKYISNNRKLYQMTTNNTELPQKYEISTNYTKLPQTIPNYHKQDQMTIKYTQLSQTIPNGRKIFHMTVKRTKMCPNYYFWYENIPYGNPGVEENLSVVNVGMPMHKRFPQFSHGQLTLLCIFNATIFFHLETRFLDAKQLCVD